EMKEMNRGRRWAMTQLCVRDQKRMIRMADLRARGAGWPTVAAELGVREETCRRWARDYPRTWRRLSAQAEREVVDETRAEGRLDGREPVERPADHLRDRAHRAADRGCVGACGRRPADGLRRHRLRGRRLTTGPRARNRGQPCGASTGRSSGRPSSWPS